jgi:hypothetical protein
MCRALIRAWSVLAGASVPVALLGWQVVRVTRRHADSVEVLRRDDEPAQFLWRGRLHVVRAVLGHWVESVPGWRGREAAALQVGAAPGSISGPGASALLTAPVPPSPKWGQRAWGEPAPDVGCAIPLGGLGLPEDREIWRVEAGAGRSGPAGIYDLILQPEQNNWLLTRVHD